MRQLTFLFAAVAAVAGLAGCSGPEHKLARGVDNTLEVVRWGDMRRSIEQGTVFSYPDVSYSYGIIHGVNQSFKRIGIGVYEVATFPFPSYKPVFTNSVPIAPQYPESYKPGVISSSLFDTDTHTGFSGGDVAPFIPGSRFSVFDD